MGTHQSGNGGNVPPDGDRVPPEDDPVPDEPLDLSDLPPEWGEVTIPDDLAELADEAEQIRRELAEQRRQGLAAARWRHPAAGNQTEPSVGAPLLIMAVAVVITLVSLFAMAWSGSGAADRANTTGQQQPPTHLPYYTLTDEQGRPVQVTSYLPAAILLVEACQDCGGLIADTAAMAPAGVTVIAIGGAQAPPRPAALPAGTPSPVRLADPDGRLRADLDLGAPTNAATVVLVDRTRAIVRTIPVATTIGQFQGDLTDLTR